LSLAATPSRPAQAITVIDPTNLAQNILQAGRALEQINNQIRQIEQQASMLARNPLQLSPELSQSIGQTRQLFTAAQGLTFQVNQMSEQLHALYPDTWANFNLGQISDRTQQWLREDRTATEQSIAAQAQAAQSIEAMQAELTVRCNPQRARKAKRASGRRPINCSASMRRNSLKFMRC